MAYRRRKFVRRRGYRRGRRNAPGQSMAGKALSTAYRGLRIASMLKGIVNSERKYADLTTVNGSVTSTGGVGLINQIPQGDAEGTRDGNSILCKYLTHIYRITQHASATQTQVRVIIFMDTSNQGSTPAVTDVLASANVLALKNQDNQTRFVILKDHFFNLSSTGTTIVSSKWYMKINKHLKYASGTDTAVRDNALYVLTISSEATNAPTMVMNSRVAYYDN